MDKVIKTMVIGAVGAGVGYLVFRAVGTSPDRLADKIIDPIKRALKF